MEEKETVPLRRNKCKARRKNAEEVVGRQKQAKVQQKVRELKGEDCSAGELLEHRSEGEGREVAGGWSGAIKEWQRGCIPYERDHGKGTGTV